MITYLVDTSAYVHLSTDPAANRHWDTEIETGAIGVCEATRAEILFSATSVVDRDEIDEDLTATFAIVPVLKEVGQQDVRRP